MDDQGIRITQRFGRTPFALAHYDYYRNFKGILGRWIGHPGIDFVVDDRQVRALTPGPVVKAGEDGNWGNVVVVYDGGRWYRLYSHLDEIYVSEGDHVRIGQKIGLEGDTGLTQGAHTHYGKYYRLLWRKIWVDPIDDFNFNLNTMSIIDRIVEKNRSFVQNILDGKTAYGMDHGRDKPFKVENSQKEYFNSVIEMLAHDLLLGMTSENADTIPNKPK